MAWTTATAVASTCTASSTGNRQIAVTAGTVTIGTLITGTGITGTVVVTRFVSGTLNGPGVYEIDAAITFASTTVTCTRRTHTFSGDETSFDGMAAFPGVTRLTPISAAVNAAQEYLVYGAKVAKAVNATLTLDIVTTPVCVRFAASPLNELDLNSSGGGVYINGAYTVGTGTSYLANTVFRFTRIPTGNGAADGSIRTNPTATFSWVGCTIETFAPLAFYGPTIFNYAVALGSVATASFFIGNGTTQFVGANPLTVKGMAINALVAGMTLTLSTDGSAYAIPWAFSGLLSLQNCNFGNHASGDGYLRGGASSYTISRNSNKGMKEVITPFSNGHSSSGGGRAVVRQLLQTATDSDGNPIASKTVWVPRDDGGRQDNSAYYGQALANEVLAPNQTWVTDASTGLSDTQDVRLKTFSQKTIYDIDFHVCRFSNDGADEGICNLYGYAYGYLITPSSVSLNSQLVYNNKQKYLTDSTVVQRTMATVAAYSLLNCSSITLNDYLAYYLFANYNAQTAKFGTRSGTKMIFPGSIVLDPAATFVGEVSISGTTVTIKTAVYTGDMEATGIITLLNGATINGSYTDSTGTRAALTITDLQAGSDVVISTTANPDGSGSNVIATFDSIAGTSVSYGYIFGANLIVNIAVYKPGLKAAYRTNYPLGSNNSTLPISQRIDKDYTP